MYYSLDDNGEAKIPRLAIRMEGHDKIAEDPRGIAYKQNLDPYVTPVLEEKLKEFGPIGEAYNKKTADMDHLTALVEKGEDHEPFTKEDLVFLYELDTKIEGFGYQRDPRIAALRDARDTTADLPILFDCAPKQIAHSVSEIIPDTKAYIGKLEKGIFEVLPPAFEHIYTKFPEDRVKSHRVELGIGIKSGSAFERALSENGMKVYDWAKELLESPDFKVFGEHTNVDLVEVSVAALGFDSATPYDAICARAHELGLELCQAEVGPQLCLQCTDQSMNEYLRIGMNPISVRGGNPFVFRVGRGDDGLWLGTGGGRPDDEWDPDHHFVFSRPRSRKDRQNAP